MSHQRNSSLTWSAEDPASPAPQSQPAFFPVDFTDRQQSDVPSSTGTQPQQQAVWMPPSGGSNYGNDFGSNDHTGGRSPGAQPSRPPTDSSDPSVCRFGDPADDLPLLEELGIFPDHIRKKSWAVLHPLRGMPDEIVEDSDVAGPLVFTVLLAFLLTLQGKLHFGAIYGVSVLGIFCAHALLTLMSDANVKLQLVISTLGYCLLPNLVLAVCTTLHLWVVGRSHGVTLPLSVVTIAWSAWCATSMFTQAFHMRDQRFLILYPTTLLYAVFAALTIF